MKVKMILPALTEAKSPFWRPIKYSLFPPLGLATLATFLLPDDNVELVDDHIERLMINDEPDLVVIPVYITNAYRAYALADHYRAKGCRSRNRHRCRAGRRDQQAVRHVRRAKADRARHDSPMQGKPNCAPELWFARSDDRMGRYCRPADAH